MSDDDSFTIKLSTLIQEGLDKDINPYTIIGYLETTKQSIINVLLGVENECE
jgi:hypothetical protein